MASALLFAVSYTFWSQSVIAEVYGLHMLCVSLTLWLLLRWAARPTLPRLGVFFAVYALGFGNHLSMILLLPAFTMFLLVSAPDGWRSMVRPRVVALAAPVCRRRRPAVRLESAHALVRGDPAARARGSDHERVVRHHQSRLARHHGDERAAR